MVIVRLSQGNFSMILWLIHDCAENHVTVAADRNVFLRIFICGIGQLIKKKLICHVNFYYKRAKDNARRTQRRPDLTWVSPSAFLAFEQRQFNGVL
jgi:hypothetical protein